MKQAEVAENVTRLVENPPARDEFIYEPLLACGKPKASMTRLKQGTYNQSKVPGEVLWKKEVYFKKVEQASRLLEQDQPNNGKQAGRSLYDEIEALKKAKGTKTHNPRFLFVTDFVRILAVDRKTNDSLDIDFEELKIHFDFFLPWAGMEKPGSPTRIRRDNRFCRLKAWRP